MGTETSSFEVLLVGAAHANDEALRSCLSAGGFTLRLASSGIDAVELAARSLPDVAVIDAGISDVDTRSICRHLHRASPSMLIIVLVGASDGIDVAEWLDLGVDDCVREPTGPVELLARIRHGLRRRGVEPVRFERLRMEVGALRVDLGAQRAVMAGVELDLSPIEFQVLASLTRHAGLVTSYQVLLREVWGETRQTDETWRAVRATVTRLRKVISDLGPDPVIATFPRSGYRLSPLR